MADPRAQRFDEEWSRFLNELRVTLPGVQFLFAFLLTVPFASGWKQIPAFDRGVYFVCFLTATGASAFLMAPAVYHRLHWRGDVQDKEQMFQTCNRLAITGGVLLAISMTLAVFIISTLLVPVPVAAAVALIAAALFGWLWFCLPLARKGRGR